MEHDRGGAAGRSRRGPPPPLGADDHLSFPDLLPSFSHRDGRSGVKLNFPGPGHSPGPFYCLHVEIEQDYSDLDWSATRYGRYAVQASPCLPDLLAPAAPLPPPRRWAHCQRQPKTDQFGNRKLTSLGFIGSLGSWSIFSAALWSVFSCRRHSPHRNLIRRCRDVRAELDVTDVG